MFTDHNNLSDIDLYNDTWQFWNIVPRTEKGREFLIQEGVLDSSAFLNAPKQISLPMARIIAFAAFALDDISVFAPVLQQTYDFSR